MSLPSPLFFPGTLLLVLIVVAGVMPARPMPLSCAAWATGECLSWHDGRVGQFRNLSSPRACCAACNQVAKCRAWSLYGAEHGGNNTYCDLYASDKPDRFKCKQGISSLSNNPPVPPPPPPKPGTVPLNVLLLVVDDLRYQFGFEGPGVEGPGCSAPSSPDPAGFFPACGKMYTPALDKLVSSPGTTVFTRNYGPQTDF